MTNFGGCVHYTCIYLFLFSLSLFADFSNATQLRRYKRQNPNCIPDQEYRCKNGQCIDKSLVCDGVVDCVDSSDETHEVCHDLYCPRYAHRCGYGACINGEKRCDGRNDCADKSDESQFVCPQFSSHELCKKSEYQCFSGQCIEAGLLCDGNRDCNDGTDETYLGCLSTPCDSKRFFRCDYGACIDKRLRCNGQKNCADGSDEFPEICNPRRNITTSSTTTTTTTTAAPVTPKKTPSTSRTPITRPTPSTSTLTTSSLPNPSDGNEGSCPEIPPSNDKTILYQCKKKLGKACYESDRSIKEATVAKFSCNPDYLPGQDGEMRSVCSEGSWLPAVPKCHKICDKLNPVNVDLTCYREGSTVDCEDSLIAGTKIRPRCKNLHIYSDFAPFYQEIVCQEDGRWDKILFSCHPECGRSYTNVVTLISQGTKESYGDSPWHVAIYNQNKTLICGGTIITPYLILSAAHCFHDRLNNVKLGANLYEVVVSKATRNYQVRDNESQRVHKIKEIRFSPRGYNANIDYFANDIVILILFERIAISSTVLPACVDWIHSNRPQEKYFIPEGTLGKVSGWGMNEFGKFNESLFGTQLPYISREKCISTVPSDFKAFITYDKFCAGTETGSSVLQGDSGGGLLFKEGSFYYIRGLVSLKQPSQTALAAFTDLSEHVDWILSVRKEIEKDTVKMDTISIRG